MNIRSLTQQDIAALMGVSPQAVRAPNSGVPRNPDGSYDGPAVMAWQRSKALVDNSDDDAMLTRYKALRQAVAYERELGLLVDRETVAAGLRASFVLLRQLGERLQKLFGHDAYVMVVEALEEAESAAINVIKSATAKQVTVEDDDEPEPKPKAKRKTFARKAAK